MTEFIRALNWVDYVILFGLIRGAFVGYRDGIFRELLRIFLYLVTLAIILSFSGNLADYVGDKTFLSPETATVFVILAVALITYLVLKILADLLLKIFALDGNIFLKLLGLFLGLVRWAAILSFLFLVIDKNDFAGLGTDIYEAQWGPHLAPIASNLVEFMSNVLPEQNLFL